MNNPFAVQTPEDIPAEEACELFVDVFTDFYHVPKTGHTFLNGPRGSGKSMMFRYMLPDCQKINLKKPVKDLDYLAIYVPIKKTQLNTIDLQRLQKHAEILLNEHLMCCYIAVQAFISFETKIDIEVNNTKIYERLRKYYLENFKLLIKNSGWLTELPDVSTDETTLTLLKKMESVCDQLYLNTSRYVREMAFINEIAPYSGPICGYLDFLFPLLTDLKQIVWASNKPFYLLIDDADNLSKAQTRILNTWVSFRTSKEISLKISTQLNYKTYRTITGMTIDTPHDYSEVNIATVYTSSKEKYLDRIRAIIEKRLQKIGINMTPEKFFPPNEEQEKEIQSIYQTIKKNYPKNKRGYRATDDAYRYATPDYIKSLKGPSKSGHTYSYSGFRQLVNISSGIIRYFLEPASQMYAETFSLEPNKPVTFIGYSVQNKVIREYSNQFLFNEFDKMLKDEAPEDVNKGAGELSTAEKLKNLIFAMGGIFHAILISEAAERRVFSIALNDLPDKELEKVLQLGVRFGYIQESSIGNKEGTGRVKLYILSRRLAPFFTLDPTGFSGYKFMNSYVLKKAMYRPQHFINNFEEKLRIDSSEDAQLKFFEEKEGE